jgi:hypothetical protein
MKNVPSAANFPYPSTAAGERGFSYPSQTMSNFATGQGHLPTGQTALICVFYNHVNLHMDSYQIPVLLFSPTFSRHLSVFVFLAMLSLFENQTSGVLKGVETNIATT